MEIVKKMNEIFREVFDDDTIEVRPQMTADDVDGWDSLSHINLILAVEAAFKIRFSQKELLSFKNVGDLINCIERKISIR
jgi:acyl carrier protein